MNLNNWASIVLKNLPIQPKTLQNYESMYRCHIGPIIGSRKLDSVSRLQIQGLIQGLPAQTGAMVLAVIKTLYREAIAAELVSLSPATNITHPKIQVNPRKFLTIQELKEYDLGKFQSQIIFLAAHGLRWGEALALTENDIHGGRVHISKSIYGPTKSLAGIRTVPHITQFQTFPRTPKALRKSLAKSGVHIHSLRHTYAYLLKTSGVHVTTAQKLMGHSDPKITLGIYTRFRDNEIDEAGSLIRAALAG